MPPTGGNLPRDQAMVWLSAQRWQGFVPQLTTTQLPASKAATDAIGAAMHARSVLPLEVAVSPNAEVQSLPGGVEAKQIAVLGIPRKTDDGRFQYLGDELIALYVATPAVLQHFGIDAASVDPTVDVLSSRAALTGYDLIGLGRVRPKQWVPKVQRVALPAYTSSPVALITPKAMREFGLTTMPIAWLVQGQQPLTPSQIDTAQPIAAAAGLHIESRPVLPDLSGLRDGATGSGIAVALGVLAMTVGLIRSGSLQDLRILTAAGARGTTRRTLTAATATALAVLGAVLGTLAAYLALIAWYHSHLAWLGHVPVEHLLVILVGLPAVAGVVSWLLAGREPSAIARSPLE